MSARRCVPEVSSESQIERFKRKILHFLSYCFLYQAMDFCMVCRFNPSRIWVASEHEVFISYSLTDVFLDVLINIID